MIRMRRILPLVTVLLFTLTSSVWAQAPQTEGARPDNPWLTPTAAVILAGFIIAVSIKKSKREHRD